MHQAGLVYGHHTASFASSCMVFKKINRFKHPEEYLEPCRTFKVKHFAKKVNSFLALTNFKKHSILDLWQGSEYSSDIWAMKFSQ